MMFRADFEMSFDVGINQMLMIPNSRIVFTSDRSDLCELTAEVPFVSVGVSKFKVNPQEDCGD
jgi:hypothetical protein